MAVRRSVAFQKALLRAVIERRAPRDPLRGGGLVFAKPSADGTFDFRVAHLRVGDRGRPGGSAFAISLDGAIGELAHRGVARMACSACFSSSAVAFGSSCGCLAGASIGGLLPPFALASGGAVLSPTT